MSNVTSILATDLVSDSRSTINTNFGNLNTDKLQQATIAQALASVATTVAITPSIKGEIQKIVYKDYDEGSLTSTLVTDSVLTVKVGANEIWEMRGILTLNAGNTVPDAKLLYTAPAGTIWNLFNADNQGSLANTRPSVVMATLVTPATTVHTGIFRTGSVAGSIALAWGQNVNTPSSVTTLFSGSYLKFERLL